MPRVGKEISVDDDRHFDQDDAHNRCHQPHDGVGHHRGHEVSNGHQSRE